MKQYTVWYKSGAGGMFVAWLLQTCINPNCIEDALRAFPKKLLHTIKLWKDYEQIPNDIGILCNVLHSTSPYYANDLTSQTQNTIDKLIGGGQDFYDLLHCRIKYYLVNCVFESGFVKHDEFNFVKENISKYKLNDVNHVKEQTDIIFNMNKNIFVVAPELFSAAAAKSKNVAFQSSDINDVLLDPDNHLNVFRLETLWNDTWIQELEKVTSSKLSTTQLHACRALVTHYLDLNVTILKGITNEV